MGKKSPKRQSELDAPERIDGLTPAEYERREMVRKFATDGIVTEIAPLRAELEHEYDAVEAAAEAGDFKEASRLYRHAQFRQLQIQQDLTRKIDKVTSMSGIGKASVEALSVGNKELARIMAPQLTPPAIHELARATEARSELGTQLDGKDANIERLSYNKSPRLARRNRKSSQRKKK